MYLVGALKAFTDFVGHNLAFLPPLHLSLPQPIQDSSLHSDLWLGRAVVELETSPDAALLVYGLTSPEGAEMECWGAAQSQ